MTARVSMFKENPIKEIAIVADARLESVVSRKSGGIRSFLSAESREALENIIPRIKKGLIQKGYKVTFAEPVGIGYYNPIHGGGLDFEPAYVYPIAQNNKGFNAATRNVFERGLSSDSFDMDKDQLPVVVPIVTHVPDDIARAIQEFTGGDTVCFTRIYGQKVPRWHKTAEIIRDILLTITVFGIIVVPFQERMSDTVVTHFTCVDAKNGDILLQYGVPKKENPLEPSDTYIDKVLKYFPEINKPLNPEYVREPELRKAIKDEVIKE